MTEQPKEWFRQGFGYRESSGVYIEGREVGYSLITDEATGYTYYKDGGKEEVVLGTSLEVGGHTVKDKEPGKVIFAKNGDIHLEKTHTPEYVNSYYDESYGDANSYLVSLKIINKTIHEVYN